MTKYSHMLTGYTYAEVIHRTCEELHDQLGVVPVVGYVYQKNDYGGGSWRHILCHPEDKEKTDEKTFEYPFRDI